MVSLLIEGDDVGYALEKRASEGGRTVDGDHGE
jgi:hypothetical protein